MASTRARAGLEKANDLVGYFGRVMGVDGAHLDANADRSFGEAGFRYDASRQVLIGRVFIGRLRLDSGGAKRRAIIDRNVAAMNDPAIGGMFEKGGGRFVMDESADNGRGMLFLVREFPIETTSRRDLHGAMEELMNIGATWTQYWGPRVARITRGEEPVPTGPVKRSDPLR